jgi:large subunit ribosomal protein L22
MKTTATAKYVGTSTRKIGLVAQLIRGKKANEAVTILDHTAKRATDPVGKVLKSAIANAENNQNMKAGDLVVEQVLVGPSRTLKRFRPRARGAAASIRKRSSHITVILTDSMPQAKTEEVVKPAENQKPETAEAKKPAAKKAEAKPATKAAKKEAK